MPKQWSYSTHDESLIRQLSGGLRVSPLIAQVLLSRGFKSPEDARAFLDAKMMELHPPTLLPGVEEASDHIINAIQAGRRITIYGDYDVDGVTSTSLLWHCLSLVEAKVDYYIPSRLEEGYGLNCDAIRQLHEEDPQRLVITVDCGIASVKEAALARELGLDLIITDHHNMAEQLPDALTLVHPRLPGGEYPFGDLCGVGVAFKLAWAVCQKLGDGKKASPRMREFLMSAVGLTSIGTIADVVPLLDENRIIVKFGLRGLMERSSVGLKALMKVAGLMDNKVLRADDIGFGIGPRINAAGRMGQARLAVELLTTDNKDRAVQLAEYLDKLNKTRQTVERKIFKQAKEQVAENPDWEDASALVLASEDWHPGVIGIVASRVVEHFEKPTILIAINTKEGVGQGSGRSFANFDLHSAMGASAEHLLTFGGHKAAAGLRISPENIDAFRQAFCNVAAETFRPSSDDLSISVDAEVMLQDVTWKAVTELDRLGPYGQSHPAPKFVARNVELAAPPRKVGEGERHLSLKLKQYRTHMKAIAFGKADWAEEMEAVNGPISICFVPKINTFRGHESVDLHLVDWTAEEAVGAGAVQVAEPVTADR